MASITNEELMQLCDFDGEKYIQKSGDDYISAFHDLLFGFFCCIIGFSFKIHLCREKPRYFNKTSDKAVH